MKKRIVWIVVGVIVVVIAVALILISRAGGKEIVVADGVERIGVTSEAFADGGLIPVQFTGHGVDISPPFALEDLSDAAQSIAIIMEDLDIPVLGRYTHWTIWNIPVRDQIPEAIPAGETVAELSGAVQGMGYGEHQYKGPKPPFGTHRYQFHFFVLDTHLDLDASGGREELLAAMEGHVLQYGTMTGWYPVAK